MSYSKKQKRTVIDKAREGDIPSEVYDFKTAHQSLMVEYFNLINRVSKLPFFVDSADVMYGKFATSDKTFLRFVIMLLKIVEYIPRKTIRLVSLRFLIRLFVESHIKGKLKQLEASYIQYAQTIMLEGDRYPDLHNWLKEAAESSHKFASTLSSWQSLRGLINILFPISVGLILARLKLENLYQLMWNMQSIPLGETVIIILPPLAYFTIFITCAFAYKRWLFLPSYCLGRPITRDWWDQVYEQQDETYNIYATEDQLFNLLDRKKSTEFPIDVLAWSLAFFIVAGVIVWRIIDVYDSERNLFLIPGFILFTGVLILLRGVRRKDK